MGGPIWADPIHDVDFVKGLLQSLDKDKSRCAAYSPCGVSHITLLHSHSAALPTCCLQHSTFHSCAPTFDGTLSAVGMFVLCMLCVLCAVGMHSTHACEACWCQWWRSCQTCHCKYCWPDALVCSSAMVSTLQFVHHHCMVLHCCPSSIPHTFCTWQYNL
jgi:hypothetical protein